MQSEPVLVSGATGYVGGRLVPLLLDAGYRVRVLGRSLKKLSSRPWAGHKHIEMKLPGEAVLEYRLHALPEGGTELQQLSRFLPKGIAGIGYWYILYPFHQVIFRGMLKSIGRSVGKPILDDADRFAPRLPHVCRIDPTANP